jgi:hypothetical protein
MRPGHFCCLFSQCDRPILTVGSGAIGQSLRPQMISVRAKAVEHGIPALVLGPPAPQVLGRTTPIPPVGRKRTGNKGHELISTGVPTDEIESSVLEIFVWNQQVIRL